MNTRVLILVGALLSLSIAAVIVGRHRSAGHSALKETAVQLIREGRSGEAVPLLRQALAAKPNYAEAYHALGIACGNLGDAASAEACLRKAIALKPDYPTAVYNLASVCERQRRYAEALKLLAQAESMRAGCPGARAARARILFAMGKDAIAAGDTAGGERLFVEAAAADPDFADARYGLGKLYHRRGMFKEAVAQFTLVAQMRPGAKVGPALRDAYAEIGKERARAGDYAAAADAYRHALLLDENNGVLRYRYGAALVRRGNSEAGGKELAEARRAGGKIEEPDAALAAALAAGARSALTAGDLDGATGRLDLAALVDPRIEVSVERAGISTARGDRASKDGDAVAAVRFYREAEKNRPDGPGLAGKLARALAAAGERDEAIERYELQRAREPENKEFLAALATLYEGAGGFARAADCYATIGDGARSELAALYDRWASHEKDPAAVAALYRKCLDLEPGNDRFTVVYAHALARQGECERALDEIRKLMGKHREPPRPLLKPLQIGKLEAVRMVEGLASAKGTHTWHFVPEGRDEISLGVFTVTGGKQRFIPRAAYAERDPRALRILFAGPDEVEGGSALEIRYDGGKEKRIVFPVLKAPSALWADGSGFTWTPRFTAPCRVTFPRGDLPYNTWHHVLGLIYRECGRAREARECAEYHSRWAEIYSAFRYVPETEQELKWALDICPEHFESRLLYTVVLYGQKRYQEALSEARAAAALKPGSPIPLNDQGVILAAQGRYQEAEMFLLRAVEKDKKFLTACRNLQELYGKMGKEMERKYWGFQCGKVDSKDFDYYEDGLWL